VVAECDLPDGVFNMVVGRDPEAEWLGNHGVDMQSLTGSTQPVLGQSVRRINHRVAPPDFAAVG